MDSPGCDPCSIIGQVASGKRSKSEELGYGDNEFVPWQIGAVMWVAQSGGTRTSLPVKRLARKSFCAATIWARG